jgi:hypothetical protein
MFVKVTGTPFVRDINSMGISNTDTAAKDEYYNKVRLIQSQKQQINKVNEELSELKGDMAEIKTLLAQLLTNKQ